MVSECCKNQDVTELTLVNVGKNTALSNSDMAQQFVQLFVIADGELQMAGDDTGLLVVTCGIASQLENFRSQIFEDSGQVYRGTYSERSD